MLPTWSFVSGLERRKFRGQSSAPACLSCCLVAGAARRLCCFILPEGHQPQRGSVGGGRAGRCSPRDGQSRRRAGRPLAPWQPDRGRSPRGGIRCNQSQHADAGPPRYTRRACGSSQWAALGSRCAARCHRASKSGGQHRLDDVKRATHDGPLALGIIVVVDCIYLPMDRVGFLELRLERTLHFHSNERTKV